jgi:hypothetical protein
MPSGLARFTGSPNLVLLSTVRATTGAGSWLKLGVAYSKFSVQVLKAASPANTTAYTVLLQGTLSTASTALRTIVSYALADNATVKVSTGGHPVTHIRYSVSAIGGTSGANGFGIRSMTVAAVP